MTETGQRRRVGGYLPIRDYAALGDQHAAALVGIDGSIDWLCAPSFDSPWLFGALLDAGRGGRQELRPRASHDARRRYLPETSVLETTYTTGGGSVRVTEAMPVCATGAPVREVVRRVEGLAGEVELEWSLAPRFDYREPPAAFERRDGGLIARGGGQAAGIQTWGVGEGLVGGGEVRGRFQLAMGKTALLAVRAAAGERHLAGARRDELETRLDHTAGHWRRWLSERSYDGPWRDAVLRSALVLKLLTFAPTGAVAAAATSSLPESLGADRNWDYRFSWLRDSSFAVDALLRLGDDEEARRFLVWLMRASDRTHPKLQPFYRLDGGEEIAEHELDLDGYRGSRPVRSGNAAVSQRQLGSYGDLFQTAWIYVARGEELAPATGKRLAEVADHVCEAWRRPDAGIWELPDYRHYTESKLSCWIALDRAVRLARSGQLPAEGIERWQAASSEVGALIEARCWSDERRAYARSADANDLDAGVLMAVFMDYGAAPRERLHATVDRIREELAAGPLVYRYSGMAASEGAFLPCSFWLVHALARLGRLDEAAELMDELVGMSNDVGLYAEEIDPASGEFLGNLPQALTHLALVNAAVTFAEVESGRRVR